MQTKAITTNHKLVFSSATTVVTSILFVKHGKIANLRYFAIGGQFHQHFMRGFFLRKFCAKLFVLVVKVKLFIGERKLAQLR
jgi:hypothetical protein